MRYKPLEDLRRAPSGVDTEGALRFQWDSEQSQGVRKVDPAARVLLIDDEGTLLEYLSKRLLREGLVVLTADSGEKGLEIAREQVLDVAVVDLKMPGLDGVETQRRLKQIQPFIQCIVLTGHGSIQTALESGKQDAFQYLLKPADYGVLLEAIRGAHLQAMEARRKEFDRRLQELTKAGLGAKALRSAVVQLRKSLGLPQEEESSP